MAPLRYGAGVKGKVNQALAHGLPVVATPCAVEGMHLVDGQDGIVDPVGMLGARVEVDMHVVHGNFNRLQNAIRAVKSLQHRGLARLREIPGVRSAAVVSGIPIETGLNLNFDRLDTPEREVHLTDWHSLQVWLAEGECKSFPGTSGGPVLGAPSSELTRVDLFDSLQLASVVAVCRQSKSMSDAGRKLFAVSRAEKAKPNDADRLKKFLARHDLTWEDIRRRP